MGPLPILLVTSCALALTVVGLAVLIRLLFANHEQPGRTAPGRYEAAAANLSIPSLMPPPMHPTPSICTLVRVSIGSEDACI